MKKLSLFILFSLLCTGFFFTKQFYDKALTLTEINKVLDDSEKGWNNGNIEQYMECYHKSEKMRFAGNGTFNFGWNNTLKRYRKSYPDKNAMGKLSFSDVDITVINKDAALVFGRWTLKYPDRKRTGLYTLLLRKFEEGWRIVHDHSSSAE